MNVGEFHDLSNVATEEMFKKPINQVLQISKSAFRSSRTPNPMSSKDAHQTLHKAHATVPAEYKVRPYFVSCHR